MADGFAQSVKQQADIVRIIGEYIRLTKSSGQSFKGLCPFHKEKTPSFNVQAAQQFFHCFGCGQSGDVFTFVQKMENLSFPEAVRSVAQKCGIPLPKREFSSPEEAQASRLRSKLLEIHDQACRYFEEQLQSPEAARAREYLTSRGVTADAIAAFRIGYAPDSYSTMRDRFQSGFDEEVLRGSGLFSSKDQGDGSTGTLYTRFRKRITFPIRNEAGRVIAFTARALDNAYARGRARATEFERLNFEAYLALHGGDHDRADSYSRMLVARYPRDPRAYSSALGILALHGRFAEATAITERAIALDSAGRTFGADECRVCIGYRTMSEIARIIGDLPRAEAMARRAVAVSPDDPSAWGQLGTVPSARGRYDEAIAATTRAAKSRR